MKKLIFIFSLIAIISCSEKDPEEQIKNLNGYWQIEKVEVANDSVVEYSLSQYIDYIEMKDSTGFRKKLQPQLDGGYIEASKNSEAITARIEGNQLILQYKTPFDKWQEEVVVADGEHLIIKNADDKKYYYKKYEPLLSNDEEATQE